MGMLRADFGTNLLVKSMLDHALLLTMQPRSFWNDCSQASKISDKTSRRIEISIKEHPWKM